MSASFVLTLDTTPPAEPSLEVNGGAAVTAVRLVTASLSTADYPEGDAQDMILWGDVDPEAEPLIQPEESVSTWISLSSEVVLMLSEGSGVKRVYARLRDDVGNTTVAFQASISYEPDRPSITVVTPVTRSRISLIEGHDEATFTWEPSFDIDRYVVRVVPSVIATHTGGKAIPDDAGSINVAAEEAISAGQQIQTTIHGADLQAASPGDTTKIVKVFARGTNGMWSV